MAKYLDYAGFGHFIGKLKNGEVFGKGLSANDLTNDLLAKLNATVDTTTYNALKAKVEALEALFTADTNEDKVIDKVNEVFSFLAGLSSDAKLKALLDGKADSATTLAGYGITDAKIDAGVITLGNNTIKPLTTHQSLADYAKTADVNSALDGKVDKVDGKALSTNDYTDAEKAEVAKVKNKVDAITGKGLSTNDYTDAEKAEVAKVKDKVDAVTGKGLSTNDYDNAAVAEVAKIKDKLDAADLSAIATTEIDTLITA